MRRQYSVWGEYSIMFSRFLCCKVRKSKDYSTRNIIIILSNTINEKHDMNGSFIFNEEAISLERIFDYVFKVPRLQGS